MKDLTNNIFNVPAKAEQNWTSKKELMEICNCSNKSLERAIADLNRDIDVSIQNHIKKGGYNNLETYYDDYLVRLIQAKLLSNQVNQGNSSDEIKELVATAVRNELTKKLTKEEIRIELARNKTLQLQSKAQIESSKSQRQIVTEQERTKREQIRYDKEEIIFKRKEVEAEILRQQNIKKALKIKSFTEPLKKEIKTMTNELAQQAIQAEYTKKLKELDADGKYMLYIFHNPTNPTSYKIGKSNSLGNRLAIGTSENPNLQILYKRWCSCQMACDELEDTIHQELREYNYKHYSDTGSTEWFVLTKDKLNEIVKKYQFVEVN